MPSDLEHLGIRMRRWEPLSRYSSIRIGGACAAMLYPATREELARAVTYLSAGDIPFCTVGGMTNVLPSDSDSGMVFVNTRAVRDFSWERDVLTADAGCTVFRICREFSGQNISALSGLAGIPGSIGGGVRGNAGAFGFSFSDDFLYGEVCDPGTGARFRLTREEMAFSYRDSILCRQPWILLRAAFRTHTMLREDILAGVAARRAERLATQPTGEPSLGSIFRRTPEGVSAAYYIDRAGCRGMTCGGAAVSEKHAGFIVNRGGARAADVLSLMRTVKDRVRTAFGVTLTPEIVILPGTEPRQGGANVCPFPENRKN